MLLRSAIGRDDLPELGPVRCGGGSAASVLSRPAPWRARGDATGEQALRMRATPLLTILARWILPRRSVRRGSSCRGCGAWSPACPGGTRWCGAGPRHGEPVETRLASRRREPVETQPASRRCGFARHGRRSRSRHA